MSKLREELLNDPAQLGYLPLVGDIEFFEHLQPANRFGIHEGVPVKAKKVGKLVGNDVRNAELINKKDTQGLSRAEQLFGREITVQEIANTTEKL